MTLQNPPITPIFSKIPLVAKTKQQASALATLLALTTRQICDVGVGRESLSNIAAGLNTTDLNQATAGLGNSLGNNIGGLGLTLGADDVGLALLLSTLDDESRPLGVLLGDLLLLDGLGEFLSEGHVGDRDILQGDVELGSALQEISTDTVGDGFTLGDQLCGVELGDDSLEDFVSDGRENTFIVIGTVGLSETNVSLVFEEHKPW